MYNLAEIATALNKKLDSKVIKRSMKSSDLERYSCIPSDDLQFPAGQYSMQWNPKTSLLENKGYTTSKDQYVILFYGPTSIVDYSRKMIIHNMEKIFGLGLQAGITYPYVFCCKQSDFHLIEHIVKTLNRTKSDTLGNIWIPTATAYTILKLVPFVMTNLEYIQINKKINEFHI